MELSGSAVSLQFQGDYLEAIDLPLVYSSGQIPASFSDVGTGIYLERDSTGQMTLRFPLLSNQGGMPLTITGIVEAIEPQEQGPKLRISLGRMEAEAEAEFSVVQAPNSELPSIEKVRLAFELHRLPKDARLTVSILDEIDRPTRSTINSALEEGPGLWTVALAVEVRRTNLDNGGDVGEAALYLTLPNLGPGLMEGLVAVHLDDEGQAERLQWEVVSSLDGGSVIRFLSPRGLSIFAVMVSDNALVVTPTLIPTPGAGATLTATQSVSPTRWFLDGNSNMAAIPDGHDKLVVIGGLPGPSTQRVQEIAQQAPGSVWYVVGEPNRRAGYDAGDIVTQLHDLYEEIKAADPTAKITSPSILNWEFTCLGCVPPCCTPPCGVGGYQSGRSWVDEFRAAYLDLYRVEPPVDIWAIDVYPIDWCHRPTVDHQLAIDQVSGLRQYLDAIPEQQGKPIWITELGLHWGWDDWEFEIGGCTIDGIPVPSPEGEYQTEQVIGYLGAVFDWLDENAASKNIERWFLFSTYWEITTCNYAAYAGMTLFDAPETGAGLTGVGKFFRDRVLGLCRPSAIMGHI